MIPITFTELLMIVLIAVLVWRKFTHIPAQHGDGMQYCDHNGRPLSGGLLTFGTANKDPAKNMVSIFSDQALTTGLCNPVALDSNGCLAGKVYVDGRYSLQISDHKNVPVMMFLDYHQIQPEDRMQTGDLT